jgi:hypothetical protein
MIKRHPTYLKTVGRWNKGIIRTEKEKKAISDWWKGRPRPWMIGNKFASKKNRMRNKERI